MFEGYAGTSDSGFRAEVESEEAIARGEKLADIVTDHAHHQLTGPAAAEAEARLAEFERTARFDGKIITDRKRLERYMDRHRPNVYPGVFVTCSDNPDRRLCQQDTEDGPSLGRCQPMKCRNAAFTPDNRASWQQRRTDLQAELDGGDVLAPLYRGGLEAKLAEVEEFLAAVAEPAPAGAGSA
jgi:hypothetical protein